MFCVIDFLGSQSVVVGSSLLAVMFSWLVQLWVSLSQYCLNQMLD